MITVRRSEDRGVAEHGWLSSRHTFSFADYYDEKHMGFSVLRVINEDRILGGSGFRTHPHRDMEIISYVIDGSLEHKDSMGNSTIIQPGEVQRMSAGTGIQHSEMNHERDKVTHFLQIWILPERTGIQPSYDQKSFQNSFARNELILVASKNGRDGSVSLHQDVEMFALKAPTQGDTIFSTSTHRHLWLQVISGIVSVDETQLRGGDGAGITQTQSFKLKWSDRAELILFDLP